MVIYDYFRALSTILRGVQKATQFFNTFQIIHATNFNRVKVVRRRRNSQISCCGYEAIFMSRVKLFNSRSIEAIKHNDFRACQI